MLSWQRDSLSTLILFLLFYLVVFARKKPHKIFHTQFQIARKFVVCLKFVLP